MQVKQRYGVRRVAEIAAKVARCRAALGEAPEVEAAAPALPTTPVAAETALPFVQRFPHLAAAHIQAQRRMFAAIKTANLPVEIAPRLAGINALLGTDYRSSRALSPDELHAVADAIEARRFAPDWTLHAPVIDEEAPLPDAPPESEPETDTGTTPAPLESIEWLAFEYDLALARAANRARELNRLRSEQVLLETRLREVDHAILVA